MFLILLPYLTAAASLILVLGVLCGLNRGIRQLRGRSGKHEAALQSETARLSSEIAELKTKLLEIEETGARLPAQATIGTQGAYHMVYGKVLTMYRLGQSPERIAGSLRLPKGEVDLLVKVHSLIMRPSQDMQSPVPPAAEALEKL